MTPMSVQSSVWRNREFKRSALCAIGVLLLWLTTASALTHIVVSSTLPSASVSQPYNANIGISGGSAPFHFVIDSGALPPGLTLSASAGTISGTPTGTGSFNFHVDVTGSGGAAHGDHWVALKVLKSGISVRISPASASISSGASQQFTAYVTGTSDTGVTWSASRGSISGAGLYSAPSVTSTTSVTVTATSVADPLKKGSAALTVTPTSSVSITTTSLPGADTGTSYSAALSAIGGTSPYAWSVSSGTLPSGISLDSSTGIFSGTPAAKGSYSFTAKVIDAHGGTATQPLSIAVASGSSSTFDGPAELPRVYVQSNLSNTPSPGNTINVPAGGDFQAALNSANCGDTIQLQAGATYTGMFNFPAKACDDAHWIIVRTSAPNSSLPPEGTRITPCYAGVTSLPGRPAYACSSPSNVLARIYPKNLIGPISLNSGANHYRLLGLEISRPAGTGAMVSLISPAAAADHIVLDRLWVHGTTHDETRRGIGLSGVIYAGIIDSYFNDFHCTAIIGTCTDAQAIAGGSGNIPSGQWKIVNNYLEASGENILFGGGPATITPTDIEIRRNHMFKPLLWMPGQMGFVGGINTNPSKCTQFHTPGYCPFIVKNTFELKNAARVLFEANILENNWGGFTQHGFSIVLTPRSYVKPGTTVGQCPTCRVTDVTIRYSTVSHTGGGFIMSNPMTAFVARALYGERYSLHDVTIDDVNIARYKGSNGTLFLVGNSWPTNVLNSVSINHVTGFPDPKSRMLSLRDYTMYPKMWGFSVTNNIIATGTYAVSSAGGSSNCVTSMYPSNSIPSCFSTYAFSSNALVGTPASRPQSKWPSGNYFPADAATVQWVNYNNGNGGDYHLRSTSPYKNAGSDGKDLGADVTAIQGAISGVY